VDSISNIYTAVSLSEELQTLGLFTPELPYRRGSAIKKGMDTSLTHPSQDAELWGSNTGTFRSGDRYCRTKQYIQGPKMTDKTRDNNALFIHFSNRRNN